MSRSMLVNALLNAMSQNHSKVAMTQAAANTAIDAITNAIQHSLKTSGAFTLHGFGTFRTAARAARAGVNPQTGAKLNIPATQTVTFKPSSQLKSDAATFVLPVKRGTGAAKTVVSEPPVPVKKVAQSSVSKTTTKKAKK